MATDKILIRSTLNGQVAEVSPALLDNPHLSKFFVRVEDGDNPKPMPLITPSTAEEFTERRSSRSRKKDENLSPEDTETTEEG